MIFRTSTITFNNEIPPRTITFLHLVHQASHERWNRDGANPTTDVATCTFYHDDGIHFEVKP